MTTLLIATRNRHKAAEIRALLGEGVRCHTLDEFPGAPTTIEDAPTFAGNARKKVLELAGWWTLEQLFPANEDRWFLADDSGLEVDALGGAPGVLSARFAALDTAATGNSSDAANNAKLLRLLAGIPPERRTARFRCVMAVVRVGRGATRSATDLGPDTHLFEGACEGRILFEAQGHGGFGYDPLFQPVGETRTFAELGEGAKNRISHRACAFTKFREWFRRNS